MRVQKMTDFFFQSPSVQSRTDFESFDDILIDIFDQQIGHLAPRRQKCIAFALDFARRRDERGNAGILGG
jgi:hypothetical protein